MLKLEIEKIDDAPEAVRSMYEEKNGKFRLKVDGIPDVDSITAGLKSKNEELLSELKPLKQRLKDLADAEEKARLASGSVEDVRKSYDQKIQKLTEEYEGKLSGLSGQLQGLTVGQTATALAADLAVPGSAKALLPHIRSRLSMEMRDGVPTTVVLDANGKPSATTIEELKAEFAADAAFAPLIAAGKGTGGGAAGGNKGGGAATKTMTRAAFEALSPAAKSEFSRAGGKLT